MKDLDIFLRALEERLNYIKGVFIYRKYTMPNIKFPAYKKLVLEVWYVYKDTKTLISDVYLTKKETTEEESKENEEFLLKETYKKLLAFYGI